jgi:uncharacterized membrane-anchored protein
VDDGYIRPRGPFGKDFDDFKHYEASTRAGDRYPLAYLSHQIRWSRFPQAWNYTFLELPRESQSQGAEAATFTDFMLTSILDPSVVNSTRFPDVPENRDFPGRTVGGAHYLLVRIDELLTFAVSDPRALGLGGNGEFDPRLIADRVALFRKEKTIEHIHTDKQQANAIASALTRQLDCRRRSVSALLAACLQTLDNATFQQILGHSAALPDFPDAVKMALQRDPLSEAPEAPQKRAADIVMQTIASSTQITTNAALCSFTGALVRAVVASGALRPRAKADIYRHVTEVTKSFWDATYRLTIDEEAIDVADDFVSSAMVDGRCIYFSNFMPFGAEKFTRTIFVDVDMGDYQRARILQRLCDILTYRSIPIRDLDRVRSAIEALNDMNRRLSDIQMRVVDGTAAAAVVKPVHGKVAARLKVDELRQEMAAILEVSVQTGRLNAFFTYGIAGKWSSTSAYYDQILERCEDLREQRIPGYPQLSEFVKRRLKHSIRYIERMHMHYTTVGRRTTDLLDRVRTELNALQTTSLMDDMHEQVALTQVAELVVVVACSDFLVHLTTPLNHGQFVPEIPEWGLVLCAAFVSILIVFVWKRSRQWWTYHGGIGRSRRWLRTKINRPPVV